MVAFAHRLFNKTDGTVALGPTHFSSIASAVELIERKRDGAELPREERAPIYYGMNEALARLHLVDPAAIGLADFGRAGNYFQRQTERWSKQWAASKTRENPAIDRLAEWLPAHMPPDDGETRICHGDFRLDNMILHPAEPRVIAVLGEWLQGRTLVLATHRPQLLEWVDRIAVIDGGMTLAEGPKAEMVERLSKGISRPTPSTQSQGVA